MELSFDQKAILWTAFRSKYIQAVPNGPWLRIHGVDTVTGMITTKGDINTPEKNANEDFLDVRTLRLNEIEFLDRVPIVLQSTPSRLEFILSQLRIWQVIQTTPQRTTVVILKRINQLLSGFTDGSFKEMNDWLTADGFDRSDAIHIWQTMSTLQVWIDLKEAGGVTGPGTQVIMRMTRDRLNHIVDLFEDRIEKLKIERLGFHDNF